MNKQEIEKAIEIIRVDKEAFERTNHGGFDSKIKTFETAISALEQQLTNGWIPVSERLPGVRRHDGGEPIEFIIMLIGGRVSTVGCINDEDIWGWMDWDAFRFVPLGVDVIAWQPLPEPYKEDTL